MTFLSLVPAIYANVKQYGAVGDGSTDDTTAIAAAITAASAGGVVFFPVGNYKISSPLTLNGANTALMGVGAGSTIIAAAGFSGTQMILCSAANTGVWDLAITGGPSTTYSSNPATTGIQVTGAINVQLQGLLLSYVNGWAIQSTATAGQANIYLFTTGVRVTSCAQGIHTLGVTGSGFSGNQRFIGCVVDHIQAGDCYFFEDTNDILCQNLFGATSAGSGNVVHIKGQCAAFVLQGCDLGLYPGPSTGATMLIESDVNGSPNLVFIEGGIVQSGASGISITNGTNITLSNLQIFNNGTSGISVTGGDTIEIRDTVFSANGTAGSSGRYDLQCTTSGTAEVIGCRFATPQGTTSGHTNNAVNFSTGSMLLLNSKFSGSGYTPSNIFNGVPTVVRGCAGYNPIGQVTAPAFPATTVAATNNTGVDVTAYIANGTAAITVVQVAGVGGTYVTTGYQIAASGWGLVRIPAGGSVKLTYASGSPSWTWFGD